MQPVADDSSLLVAFLSGDGDAANAIFLRFAKQLIVYVQRLTGDEAKAQDVVADVFIKLLERRTKFNSIENIRAFLFRSARNAAINVLRADSRHRAAHEQLGYLARAAEGRSEWLDNEQIRAEVLGAIYEEIETLPGRCKEIFKLIFLQGLDNEEIAGRMGIAVQTVRTQKARALGLLRAQLLKKGQLMAALYLVDLFATHT